MSKGNQENKQKTFELVTGRKELMIYLDKIDSSRREILKHIDKLSFKEITARSKLKKVLEEVVSLLEQIEVAKRGLLEAFQSTQELNAFIRENAQVCSFVRDALVKITEE